MESLTTNPTDLDLDGVAMGVVSNASEAVGARRRLIEDGWDEDDVFVFEGDEGAEMLTADDAENDDEQSHAVGHLRSGHRLLAVRSADRDLSRALSALEELGVREPGPASEWTSKRDTAFNQRVFNTGGPIAQRSAQSDEELERISGDTDVTPPTSTEMFGTSPLAQQAAAGQRQPEEHGDAGDKGLVARVLDADDDRGLMDRIRDRDPEVDETDEASQAEAAEQQTGTRPS